MPDPPQRRRPARRASPTLLEQGPSSSRTSLAATSLIDAPAVVVDGVEGLVPLLASGILHGLVRLVDRGEIEDLGVLGVLVRQERRFEITVPDPLEREEWPRRPRIGVGHHVGFVLP